MTGNPNQIHHRSTIYSHLDNNALHAMYDEGTWFNLNESQRLNLLQETVNREAIANGDKYSCTVEFADMESNVSGYQTGNAIFLNREMFVNDRMFAEYNGRAIEYNLRDSNFRAYETLMHEHQHVYQDAVSYGIVDADAHTKAMFEANNFTVSDVNGMRGSQYMTGETSFSMYMLNPTEADAFRTSQTKTLNLVSELNGTCGEKASNAMYTQRMATQSYEAKLNEYREMYNNPNVDKEVANVLMNKYHNTGIPVDKAIEDAVHKEMIATQSALDNQNKVMEESKMNNNKWADMHVSRETYDNTLRSGVNSYYEHAMNDPATSQEQAISETAQVSEGYLNAMDEFDAAQANVSNESDTGIDSGTSTDIGEGVSSGAETGTDAGADIGTDGGADNGSGIE